MTAGGDRHLLRFVALGDSYTIGTATRTAAERWPDQLVATLALRADSSTEGLAPLDLVANLAVNGSTSADVIREELPALDELRPDFLSLLVGVNDVVQGVPLERYRSNVAAILDDLLGRVAPNRIVTVATPDYTVTPHGARYGDPRTQAAGILRTNAVLGELARARGIAYVDIHDLSLRAAADRGLVADDGLHPSGRQYSLWVERIAPTVAALLSAPPRSAG